MNDNNSDCIEKRKINKNDINIKIKLIVRIHTLYYHMNRYQFVVTQKQLVY
jgi:hypothetical protein